MTVTAEAMQHIEVTVAGLRRDQPGTFGELAGVFWDIASLIEAEGLLDGLDQHDANTAMEGVVTGLVITEDNGAHKLREYAIKAAGGAAGDLHDPIAVGKALCAVAALIELPM